MKKIYTIKITDCIGRPNIWYADRIEAEFETELTHRPGTNVIVFQVTQSQFVYPIDCKVVGERLEEIYTAPSK